MQVSWTVLEQNSFEFWKFQASSFVNLSSFYWSCASSASSACLSFIYWDSPSGWGEKEAWIFWWWVWWFCCSAWFKAKGTHKGRNWEIERGREEKEGWYDFVGFWWTSQSRTSKRITINICTSNDCLNLRNLVTWASSLRRLIQTLPLKRTKGRWIWGFCLTASRLVPLTWWIFISNQPTIFIWTNSLITRNLHFLGSILNNQLKSEARWKRGRIRRLCFSFEFTSSITL